MIIVIYQGIILLLESLRWGREEKWEGEERGGGEGREVEGEGREVGERDGRGERVGGS